MSVVNLFEFEDNLLGNLRRPGVLRERNIISQNVRKGGIAILALERSRAEQHLVNQYAESPPIHSTRVSAAFDNLRRNILLRTNK